MSDRITKADKKLLAAVMDFSYNYGVDGGWDDEQFEMAGLNPNDEDTSNADEAFRRLFRILSKKFNMNFSDYDRY